MASVSSLDQDMRNMRLSKYTPKAANEVRDWIEEVLGERLQAGDLLESLKDGVALCKLVNLAVPHPGVKCKNSRMPFVQMENISHFLRAIQLPPLSLQPHDVFLTVDLYESKDPAQVLQCLGAFSRIAHATNPSDFKRAIGPKNRNSMMSPQGTGNSRSSTPTGSTMARGRGLSNASQSTTQSSNFPVRTTAMSPTLTGGSNSSKATVATNGGSIAGGPISSWSRKNDEASTAPAWNIHQYGYMGGASQGNQGIAFGSRRQITSNSPVVPSLADKEKKRKEQEAEDARARHEAEEAEREARRAEEERERIAEEARWAEETRKQREHERQLAEAEKRRWLEDEEKWKADEAKREAEMRVTNDRKPQRTGSDALQGQYLSQYRFEQSKSPSKPKELTRVQELELELEKARLREQEYEKERQSRLQERKSQEHIAIANHDLSVRSKEEKTRSRSRSRNRSTERSHSSHHREGEEWRAAERDYLRQNWSQHHDEQPFSTSSSSSPKQSTSRPLPEPATRSNPPPASLRPLSDPVEYAAAASTNRTDQYLSRNPAPAASIPTTHFPSEIGGFDSSAEQHAETQRREASQAKTKAGKWAASSLLEREMERERLRQQEWELSQRSTQDAADKGVGRGLKEATVGEGGSWDVNQYGFAGGDSQNRGGVAFGARRQIIGPRPPP